MLAQWGRVNADERSDLRTSSARVLVEAARTHLSQDLHAGGEVLACRWVSQCVLTHKGNHRVEGGHTHVLHRRQFLRLVQIHDGAAIKEREGKEWGKKSTWQPRYLFSDQYSDREINHVFSYWRDKILGVDGSLSQALWWRGHGVCLKLLDVSPQCCDLGLNCLLSLNTLALCPQEEGQKTIYTYWILLFIYFKLQTSGFNASFFFCHTVTVRLAGPWHGCPPFPLHSRAMVTCSGWFLYSRGRLSSSSCSVATCWASRATAILKMKPVLTIPKGGKKQNWERPWTCVHSVPLILEGIW